MNKSCETIHFYHELLTGDSILQTEMSIQASRSLVGDGKNQYIRPNEEMYKDLEAFLGKSIFSLKAVALTVTLDLERYRVNRRLVVPINRTFSQLHRIIQIAFGWKNHHLYEFYTYDVNMSEDELSINHPAFHKEGYKPIVHIESSKGAFEFEDEEQMKLASETKS